MFRIKIKFPIGICHSDKNVRKKFRHSAQNLYCIQESFEKFVRGKRFFYSISLSNELYNGVVISQFDEILQMNLEIAFYSLDD